MNYPYLNFQRFRQLSPEEQAQLDALGQQTGKKDELASLLGGGDTMGLSDVKPVGGGYSGNAASGISGLSLQMPKSNYSDASTVASSAPSAKGGGLGLEGQDYLNMGLMAAGALQEQKEKDRAIEEARRIEQKNDKMRAIDTARQAQDQERQNQMAERSQNMQGFNMLAEQRKQAWENARSGKFRNALTRALRGGK